jgi:uncharacterized protein
VKAAALRRIEAWQANPDRPRGLCLSTPTCSAYGHDAISRHGLLLGGAMTAWRIARCNGCLSYRDAAPVPGGGAGRDKELSS